MDALITALTRKGRGTRTPLHHPALTAAEPEPDGQAPAPFLSALHQGPAAALGASIAAHRCRGGAFKGPTPNSFILRAVFPRL